MSFFIEKEDGDWDVWKKASQVAKYLDYVDTDKSIRDHVDEDNICTFSELSEFFESHAKIKNMKNNTKFINRDGLLQLVSRSKKPKSIRLAKFLGLRIMLKKSYHEMEIMDKITDFLNKIKVKYILQYSVLNNYGNYYRIDCYLPNYKIAIEIDENNHNPTYEFKRQKFIKNKLNCEFFRYNPDDPDFSINLKLFSNTKINKSENLIKIMSSHYNY